MGLVRGRGVRLTAVLVGLVVVAVLFTWLVVPEAKSCRWGVEVWDGESVQAGYVSVPCSLSEAEVRQEIDQRPPDLRDVVRTDWDDAP